MLGFGDLFGLNTTKEIIVRDMCILDLLIKKGLITNEDVQNIYSPENFERISKMYDEQLDKKYEEIKKKYESKGKSDNNK